MCLRNVSGGKTNPQLPITELKIEDVKKIFSEEFIKQLKKIYLCGNYGDPMVGKDTMDVFRYFRKMNPSIQLTMHTNGSARSIAWWKELAELNVTCHFGIDGIGNVNSIYRRNTNFNSIIENAKSFIQAGGIAKWDFIVFRHNEHQIEEAENLSKALGFQTFRTKKTGRFFSNQKNQVKDKQEVLNDVGEFQYYLESPLNSDYVNQSLQKESRIINTYGSFDNYLDATPISCKVEQEKSIYISAEGLVFPCCWTAIQLYPWYSPPQSSQIWKILNELPEGIDSINALKKTLKEIVEGDFIQNRIPESWIKDTVKNGKLKVCSRICGKEFDPFKDQFSGGFSRKF